MPSSLDAPAMPRGRRRPTRAEREYFPKLRAASGFLDLYLIAGDDGLTTSVAIWEDRAQADAFMAWNQGWMQVLEELGHRRFRWVVP